MDAKVRVVCEKLARQPIEEILGELLRFEFCGDASDMNHCCDTHRIGHAKDCAVDRLLTSIGLPDNQSREAMRECLGITTSSF